jgi:hypothetical protein
LCVYILNMLFILLEEEKIHYSKIFKNSFTETGLH